MNKYEGLNIQLDIMQKKRLIFSELFILQNKIQTKFDKVLGSVSSKQFIILVIVASFPYPPSLTEVAKHAGCSRQNVKKISSVLEKNGFITLFPEKGTRAVRIVLEQKFYDFYDDFMEKSGAGLEFLFNGMNETQIETLFDGLHMVENNIDRSIEQDNTLLFD